MVSALYSEKRGTAIFLAPANWDPQIASNTIMPLYVGAETRQPWLNNKVVKLPSSFWKVIVRPSCQPQKHQMHRASDNFRLNPPWGTKQMKWTVQNTNNPDEVSFELWRDKFFSDKKVLTGLKNNAVTKKVRGSKKYYIGNPKGCTNFKDYFEIVITAIP